jgi:N utilization substance protein B
VEEWGPEDEPLPDSRAGARRLALEALYWVSASPGQLEDALRQRATSAHLRSENVEFASRLARAVLEHTTELDELIAATATNWHRDRIARLDGLVLRLGAAELLYLEDVPARVAIDQAVELARAYGGGKSHAFVNGVLDGIARARGIQM